MEFITGLIKVVLGAFVLFAVAKSTYERMGTRSKWIWVLFVGTLAFATMIIYRKLGGSIGTPFYTMVLFGLTIAGLSPKDATSVSPWYKRGVYAIAAGTIIGWASYIEIVSLP